jgi:hypothetical protein
MSGDASVRSRGHDPVLASLPPVSQDDGGAKGALIPIELIELPPKVVRLDDERFPDREDSWIFEHLRHYLSLLQTLPAIGVVVDELGPVVTHGHKYFGSRRKPTGRESGP